MTDTSSTPDADTDSRPKSTRWHRRPTIRALKRDAAERHREHSVRWDSRENAETRLPESEEINLGGLVLTEAFTPSTVSALYRALERWPEERPKRRRELLEALAKSRTGSGGGWHNLGPVRPPGRFVLGGGHTDPELPEGVEAVWLHINHVTPSVTVVVATFTFDEAAGDLGPLLRRDFASQVVDPRVRVHGRFGDLRARIPWARPAKHGVGYGMSPAMDQKRQACEAFIDERETSCRQWFEGWFRGRFAAAKGEQRPVIRMLFTTECAPYLQRRSWLTPVGLDYAHPLWRSTEPEGWWLADERWPSGRERRYALTLAARRSDATTQPTDKEDHGSNWYLTQRFASDQAPLAAHLGVRALLGLYTTGLGELRDRAGKKRWVRRPVADARALDDYLIRDGLDAATVTSDIDPLTNDPDLFRWGLPEFVEVDDHLPDKFRGKPTLEFVPALCDDLRQRAARLASQTQITTENIQASAQLRQAIANTTLQRRVLALSAVAAIIALITLLSM